MIINLICLILWVHFFFMLFFLTFSIYAWYYSFVFYYFLWLELNKSILKWIWKLISTCLFRRSCFMINGNWTSKLCTIQNWTVSHHLFVTSMLDFFQKRKKFIVLSIICFCFCHLFESDFYPFVSKYSFNLFDIFFRRNGNANRKCWYITNR